mgnify:CR=1 FL=1|jgi:hypothetical protein
MPNFKSIVSGSWAWWLSGLCLAVFGVAMLWMFDDTPGMSDGMLQMAEFSRRAAEDRSIEQAPPLDWQTGFLGGIFIGALACAFISGKWKFALRPEGGSGGMLAGAGKALLTGFGGGFLVMLGLQMSGDSFFGQWISALQVSSGAWVFMSVFLATAIISSILIARRFGGAK